MFFPNRNVNRGGMDYTLTWLMYNKIDRNVTLQWSFVRLILILHCIYKKEALFTDSTTDWAWNPRGRRTGCRRSNWWRTPCSEPFAVAERRGRSWDASGRVCWNKWIDLLQLTLSVISFNKRNVYTRRLLTKLAENDCSHVGLIHSQSHKLDLTSWTYPTAPGKSQKDNTSFAHNTKFL